MGDWLTDAIESYGQARTRQEAEAGAAYLEYRNMQDAAKARELGRWSGLPTDTVSRNMGAIEQDRDNDFDLSVIRSSPKLQSWITKPGNGASAQGDVPTLGAISYWFGPAGAADILDVAGLQPRSVTELKQRNIDLLTGKRRRSAHDLIREARDAAENEQERLADIQRNRPKPGLRSVWTGLSVDTVEGFRQSYNGAMAYMADAVGADTISEDWQAAFRRSQETAEAHRPVFEGATGEAVYGGFSSLFQTIPALTVGAFTGGTGTLAVMGLQTGTSSYGKYRSRGGTANEALVGGVAEGTIEAATELLPVKYLFGGFGKKGVVGLAAGFLGREMVGEQLATLGQDAVDTAIANPAATWDQYWADRPMAAFNTAIATAVTTGAVTGAAAMFRPVRNTARQLDEATAAVAGASFLDQMVGLARDSKLKGVDRVAFSDFIQSQAEETPIERVFIPAETVRSLFQGDGADYHKDEFWGKYSAQIDEASAIGGDVVLPIGDAVAIFSDQDRWETLRDSVRLSPGGMSLAEARSITQSYSDLMIERGEDMARTVRESSEQMAPALRVYDSVFQQARTAGMSINSARGYADLFAARYQTRAAQRGENAWDLFQQSVGAIIGEAPSIVRRYEAADQMDILVNAMRRDRGAPSDRQRLGRSLLDFVAARGGVEDPGGDMASMGLDKWHTEAPFRRKLIRPGADSAQGTMAGIGKSNANTLDSVALAAWEAGYFPEFQERPTINDLLDAMDAEARGAPRYAETSGSDTDEANAAVREAGDSLRAFLQNHGLDPDTASMEEIRKVVEEREEAFTRQLAQSEMWRRWDDPPPGMSNIVLNHNGPVDLPRGRPSSTIANYFGTREFSEATGSEFGPWRYTYWVPQTVADKIVVLEPTNAEGRKVAAAIAKRQFPNEPEYAAGLAKGDQDAFLDFYETWADAEMVAPTLKRMGFLGAQHKAEYLMLPEGIEQLVDRRNGADDGTITFYQSQAEHGPFYSTLNRTVAGAQRAKGTAEEWLAEIRNAPGIKAEEVEWSGIEEFLGGHNGKPVSRTDLQAFLESGGIQVDEMVLGEFNPRAVQELASLLMDKEAAAQAASSLDAADPFDDDVVNISPVEPVVEDGETVAWDFDGDEFPTQEEAESVRDEAVQRAQDEAERERFRQTEDAMRGGLDEDHFIELAKEQLGVVPQFGDWTSTGEATETYRELLITLPLGQGRNPRTAPDTHWLKPGVVAHVRFQAKLDTEGRSVLFVEEVQSDWHQKGRDQGYEVPPSPEATKAAREKWDEAVVVWTQAAAAVEAFGHEMDVMPPDDVLENRRLAAVYEPFKLADQPLDERASYADVGLARLLKGMPSYGRDPGERPFDPAIIGKVTELRAALKAAALRRDEAKQAYANASAGTKGIPQAPFKSTWPALAMKRVIRWAADNGYSQVAWTTGEQQTERYDLSEVVGDISVHPVPDGNIAIRAKQGITNMLARQGLGRVVGPFVARAGGESSDQISMTPENVEVAFGKDLGGRIVSAAEEIRASGTTSFADFSAADMRMGGEGMRQFYDRNLVNIANDLIKRHGAKVGTVRVDNMPILMASEEQLAQAREGLAEEMRRPVQVKARVEEFERSIALWEAEIERQREGSEQWGFPVTEKLADAARAGFSLFQGGESKARGRIDFDKDGRAVIRLFEGRDLSTLLHESGHLWLEELRADSKRANASDQIREDWQTVKAWFRSEGHRVTDGGPIPTDAHEMWARGMERYFMEGRAPTSALQRAFASFRSWLLRIYQVVANLDTPLNEDVRRVMDRLLATDDAIADAASNPESELLFKSADQAGMTAEEFSAYRETVKQTRTEAFDALLYRTMEALRRSKLAEWKEQRRAVRAEAEAEVKRRPEFRALALLRGVGGDRVQLNRQAIVDEHGTDILAILPRGVPPTIVDKGGVHPQILAEMSGFRTGTEMLNMLVGVEQRQRELRAAGDRRSVLQETVDIGTDAAMRERFGDPFTDGSLEEEALAAIHNNSRAEVIASEIRALARRSSRVGYLVPTPWRVAKDFADRHVREGTVSEQASAAALAQHRRNEAKAAKAAESAMLAGDVDEAFRQKQSQLYNHALFRSAKEAKEQVEAIVRRLGKLAKAVKLPSMDPEYLDRIHELLEDFDFRARSLREVKERASFAAWVTAKEEAGEEVFIPARLQDTRTVNFKQLQVQDLIALDDTIQSIAHLGRKKGKLLAAKEEADFQELVDEAVAVAEALPARAHSIERNPKPDWRSRTRAFDAMLVKVEWLADQLDGGNPNGPFNRVLVRQSTEAANEKERLVDKVLRPLVELYEGMSKEQRRRLREMVVVPEFMTRDPETKIEVPAVYSRSDLLAVALNIGNESNLDKLLRGESRIVSEGNAWTADKVMSALNRELTKEDWQFVEAVWRQVDTLWPDIVRAERDISGIKPEKVEARSVETPFGVINGGYYPVVYDPTRSAMAEANYDEDAEKMLGQMGRTISTPKGHTITRTEAAAPLLLSVEGVLLNHINRATTRIAYGRFVRDSLKFISNPRIKEVITRKLGPEYHRQLRPWLARQVNDASLDTKQLVMLDKILRQFRVNTTLVGLGFRFTTMLAQIGGLNNSISRLGLGWMAQGMTETARNIGAGKLRETVFSRSPEMAGRATTFDRDVRTAFADLTGSSSKLAKVRALAYWGIGNVQLYVVDMSTWLGAYSKATHEGMTEDEAIGFADKIVRMTQGAGRAKDLSAIQGGPEGSQVLTLFYSYFNVLYNVQRETVHAVRTGDWRRASMNVFWVMMMGPVFAAFISGDWPNEEDDEGWGEWAARKIFFGLWLGIPGVRDVMSGVEREVSGRKAFPTTAPFFRATDEMQKPIKDAIAVAKGDPVSDRWLQNAITAPGYFVGLPTGQPAATGQYLLDVSEGDQSPQNAADVARGVAKGPQRDQE